MKTIHMKRSLELGDFHNRLIQWFIEIIKDLGSCMIVSCGHIDSPCSY